MDSEATNKKAGEKWKQIKDDKTKQQELKDKLWRKWKIFPNLTADEKKQGMDDCRQAKKENREAKMTRQKGSPAPGWRRPRRRKAEASSLVETKEHSGGGEASWDQLRDKMYPPDQEKKAADCSKEQIAKMVAEMRWVGRPAIRVCPGTFFIPTMILLIKDRKEKSAGKKLFDSYRPP